MKPETDARLPVYSQGFEQVGEHHEAMKAQRIAKAEAAAREKEIVSNQIIAGKLMTKVRLAKCMILSEIYRCRHYICRQRYRHYMQAAKNTSIAKLSRI